jgi:hypothetical protein
MFTILTVLFLGGSLGIALYLNAVLDKREARRLDREKRTE